MRFLKEGERAYIGAAQLYQKLQNLNIDPPPLPPLPYIFSGEELTYYLDTLENELQSTPRGSEDYHYVATVLAALRRWADSGLVVHVRS